MYGIYCLRPRAKAINPMQPEGAWLVAAMILPSFLTLGSYSDY